MASDGRRGAVSSSSAVVPTRNDGEIVGAVGSSGDMPDEDIKIARAAVKNSKNSPSSTARHVCKSRAQERRGWAVDCYLLDSEFNKFNEFYSCLAL